VGEACLVGLALLIIPPLPRPVVVRLSRWLGALGFRLSRRDRRLALANLDVAFGDRLSDAEKTAIARESFRTFALVVLDLFWFQMFSRARLARWVAFDASMDAYFPPGPTVAVTAHFGNWEVMGLATAARGAPPVSVAAPLNNPVVGRLLTRGRRGTGQAVVGKHGAVRALLRALRGGGKVALLIDQNTLPAEGGRFVEFFGLPVPMSAAAARLSRHTQSDILPAFCVPDEGGGYRACALPPYRPAGNDEREATQRLAALLEDVIRADPGHWLWMYKRWKYVPPDGVRERYPFYAQPVDAPAPRGGRR